MVYSYFLKWASDTHNNMDESHRHNVEHKWMHGQVPFYKTEGQAKWIYGKTGQDSVCFCGILTRKGNKASLWGLVMFSILIWRLTDHMDTSPSSNCTLKNLAHIIECMLYLKTLEKQWSSKDNLWIWLTTVICALHIHYSPLGRRELCTFFFLMQAPLSRFQSVCCRWDSVLSRCPEDHFL